MNTPRYMKSYCLLGIRMNHFKTISYRSSWCQLRRLHFSVSTLNPKIEIPPRIERGPTDILHALDSTVQRDALRSPYKYHDDPFLLPSRKGDYKLFALAYESGKKTAMWIHKEHKELFPNDLSDPPIKEFQPLTVYTDKSQVSEEILLQAINEGNVSNILSIYKLLENDISNETKQALLEILCFHNGDSTIVKLLPHERWFCKYQDTKIWSRNPEVEKLYSDLIEQDSATATKAYNTMICGLAKWNQVDEAWLIYEKCKKENIPLNVNVYNSVINLIAEKYRETDDNKESLLYSTFATMNEKGIRPNVKTLNIALKVAALMSDVNKAENLMTHLITEFKRLNVKFSLGSYYYIINIISQQGESSYQSFIDILETIAEGNFTMQDTIDTKFFTQAMNIAFECYCDSKVANMIHDIFLSGNNYKFMPNAYQETGYYYSYTMVVLATCKIQEFFEYYRQNIPSAYIPEFRVMNEIIFTLNTYPADVIEQYLPRFWADMVLFGFSESRLGYRVIDLMARIAAPTNPTLIPLFADAAWKIWTFMQSEREKEKSNSFFSAMTGNIALLLLRDDRVKEARIVLLETMKHPHVFVPNMSKAQVDQLFECCLSKSCIIEALILLEYCINVEFQHIAEMAKKLHNHPELDDACRSKLIELVGNEVLETMSISASSN